MTLWHNADVDKPNDDRSVICVISGRVRNTNYMNAAVMGSYDEADDGWLYDGLSVEDSDKVRCLIWTELPKLPKEYEVEV